MITGYEKDVFIKRLDGVTSCDMLYLYNLRVKKYNIQWFLYDDIYHMNEFIKRVNINIHGNNICF